MGEQQIWQVAPRRLTLTDNEAHIWRASLEQAPPIVESLHSILSPDERERANRFFFQTDREHFVVARSALRMILSRYVELPPGRLRFALNRYGKPSLIQDMSTNLRFNVSHSNGLAIYVVAQGRDVGIDIEHVRDELASLEIAERFFSPTEVSMLRALPQNMRSIAFFNCWTRKEAYIKALGVGLSHSLDRFTVSLAPGVPALLLSTEDDPSEASRWSLTELFPAQGYRAALAIEGATPDLTYWQWQAELIV